MSPSASPSKINLKRIAHVYYIHKDLDNAHRFLLDFGFSVVQKSEDKIYYRGYGTEPFLLCASRGPEDAFGGVAWVVDSLEDLEIASKTLPRATGVLDSKAPGGGKVVTFYDAVDNFPFHLVYGQTTVEMTETFPELSYNFPTAKHRAVNKTQRFKKGPSPSTSDLPARVFIISIVSRSVRHWIFPLQYPAHDGNADLRTSWQSINLDILAYV